MFKPHLEVVVEVFPTAVKSLSHSEVRIHKTGVFLYSVLSHLHDSLFSLILLFESLNISLKVEERIKMGTI